MVMSKSNTEDGDTGSEETESDNAIPITLQILLKLLIWMTGDDIVFSGTSDPDIVQLEIEESMHDDNLGSCLYSYSEGKAFDISESWYYSLNLIREMRTTEQNAGSMIDKSEELAARHEDEAVEAFEEGQIVSADFNFLRKRNDKKN